VLNLFTAAVSLLSFNFERPIMNRFCCTILVGSLLVVSLDAFARTDQPAKRLVTGKNLQAALQMRRSVVTEGVSRRRLVQDLQHESGISILLDRRVDPSADVKFSTGYQTNAEVLQRIAATSDSLAVSLAENYVLIGPTDAATRLRTLTKINSDAVRLLRKKIDDDAFRSVSEKQNYSWARLAEPRQLIVATAERHGLTVLNPELLPHDLWEEVSIPPMAFSDFVTLVLNQFDLTFVLNPDATLKLVNVPEVVDLQQRHRVSVRNKDRIAASWKSAFPDLEIAWAGSTATVSATVEVHERLRNLIRDPVEQHVAAAGIPGRSLTLKVPASTPIGAIVQKFEESGIPIRVTGLGEQQRQALMQQRVEFDLVNLPAAEFFAKVFETTGATVRVMDSEVVLEFPDRE